MKTHNNDQGRKERITELRTTEGEDLGRVSEELKDCIRGLRDSLHDAAGRPDAFWARQRAAISESLRHSAPASKLKPVLLWAPASIVVLMCLFLFTGKSKLPAPDFAVGADQNLLVDVERALHRDCPEALAPAATLVQELR
jgi:hypothetical protein